VSLQLRERRRLAEFAWFSMAARCSAVFYLILKKTLWDKIRYNSSHLCFCIDNYTNYYWCDATALVVQYSDIVCLVRGGDICLTSRNQFLWWQHLLTPSLSFWSRRWEWTEWSSSMVCVYPVIAASWRGFLPEWSRCKSAPRFSSNWTTLVWPKPNSGVRQSGWSD